MTNSLPTRPTRRAWIVGLVLVAAMGLASCGEAGGGAPADSDEGPKRSAATGAEQISNVVLTEADATKDLLEVEYYSYDIGLPDKKGLEIMLTGDDASTLRWRIAQKPDALIMEWYAVDGKLAFETDGLVGDPTTAAKVLEFRCGKKGPAPMVLELVELDPAERSAQPAKRLEYNFECMTPIFRAGLDVPGMPGRVSADPKAT